MFLQILQTFLECMTDGDEDIIRGTFFILIIPLFLLLHIITVQYEQGIEKPTVANDNSIPVVEPLTLADVPQLSRIRLILLILNTICFGFAAVTAYTTIFLSEAEIWERRNQINDAILFILFYGFGLIITYKYYNLGLRVFVCIGVVLLVFTGLGFLYLLLPVHMPMRYRRSIAIKLIVFSYVMVIIVKFAVKLMQLLDANEHLIPEEKL